MKKNTAGQYWDLFAYHANTGIPATGIAATITATISLDDAAEASVGSGANPTELTKGRYRMPLTQGETNAYKLSLNPSSTANGVLVRALPETLTTETAAAVEPSTLTSQGVRDAMKLAPTAGDPEAGSLDKHLDGILEDTGTTLPAQIAALDIGGGTGIYACTWTVNDGSTVLEGATVSFWLAGVLRGTGTTNASGQVSMSLDAGTYTVAISLSGYTFAITTHAVSSTASTWTKTFSMTAQTISAPSNPTDCACAWLCLDENDAPVAGVIIRARPDTDVTGTGYAWSGHTREATSAAVTGLATINLPQGSKWWIRRDSGVEELFTVPATSTSTAVVSVRGGKRDTH